MQVCDMRVLLLEAPLAAISRFSGPWAEGSARMTPGKPFLSGYKLISEDTHCAYTYLEKRSILQSLFPMRKILMWRHICKNRV